jgi:hypothetical protein
MRQPDPRAGSTVHLAKLEFAHDAAIAGMEKRFVELEASHSRTVAAKEAAAADLRTVLTNLERDHATARADAAAQLAAVHGLWAADGAM